MQFRYSLYGLHVVTDRQIDGLVAAERRNSPPDVVVAFDNSPLGEIEGEPTYISPFRDGNGVPCLKAWRSGHHFRLTYSTGIEFSLDAESGLVSICWPPDRSPDETWYYLLGPVFGILLRYRGILCLHACAVVIGGRAIAITGPIRSGKSTTAAAFVSTGGHVLSEDLVPLRESAGAFRVSPGYPRIRLWPDSAAVLFGSPDALPRLLPDWEKRYFDVARVDSFCPVPAPLAAVYVLGDRSPDPKAPWIADIAQREKVWALAANTYANYLLDSAMRAQEFQSLGRLANTVPVRRITPHSDPSRVAALCELIRGDVAAVGPRHER